MRSLVPADPVIGEAIAELMPAIVAVAGAGLLGLIHRRRPCSCRDEINEQRIAKLERQID